MGWKTTARQPLTIEVSGIDSEKRGLASRYAVLREEKTRKKVVDALIGTAEPAAQIREVRSKRCLAKIPAHNLAGRIESGSVRALGDCATLRIDAAWIPS